MDIEEYRRWAARAVDWTADYLAGLRDRPVRPNLTPGTVAAALPAAPPEAPEPFEAIFADFERLVPGAMTHWQHPRFFAYFPANADRASMVAEHLVAGMAAQCMLWQTSPAATEMETRMVDWLRQALGLPAGFSGLIQDAASTATLCAILTMRERALDWRGNRTGLAGERPVRIYASAETHSSVDKAVWIAGLGQENLVKVPTDEAFAMRPGALAEAIRADRAAGRLPAGVVICVGGTSIGAFDRVAETIAVAAGEGLYTNVDAAWAGSAMICPEFRAHWAGVERADSIVFNPHKWLGAQFDYSVQFLRDPAPQIRTLGLRPDFLQTPGQTGIVNFSEWTVPLGRRFRALKLWFLIRAHGLEGLRAMIRRHVAWAAMAHDRIAALPGFEITSPLHLSLFTFRLAEGDEPTRRLLEAVNADGRLYLTQTTHQGRFVIRFQVGSIDCSEADIALACNVIAELAARQRAS
ncbi:MAG TPA: pyridoxal-dependent decarboxylase [Paracoccaceae bacterium]|nr:pyridoxal-dependent decarboxylase [Paracoccaceae bacterium]